MLQYRIIHVILCTILYIFDDEPELWLKKYYIYQVLNWKEHLGKKRKQTDLKAKEIN